MSASSGGLPAGLAQAGVTLREAEVLAAVAGRLSNREIAERLFISVRTVESHVSALLRKLGAADRAGLVRLGAQVRHDTAARARILPVPVTSFVGRARELADVCGLLTRTRLLTLVGPGGVGKTRLALRAAAAAGDQLAAVDFSAVDAGGLVVEAVARALGVVDQPGQPTRETLREAARHTEGLLVADNCEHLVEEVARCVDDLLMAGGLRVLATSREPLGVPGETVYEVEPLPVPDGVGSELSELLACDAVRLFADRAASASPGFELTEDNAAAVADLCRRLDGLPLALELAAARVRAFSPHHLAANLDRRFDLLTAGARTAPARHRTLAAAIDWSYEGLDDDERILFERLAVFRGTFGYDAVEAICQDPPLGQLAVIGCFPRLLDKSLVTRNQAAGEPSRYRLLESLRVYARQRLPADAAVPLDERHALHYLAAAEEAAPQLKGPNQQAWRARLAADQPNLRAAFAWSIAGRRLDVALRFLSALSLYWDNNGQRREAAGCIAQILTLGPPPPTPASVEALAAASFLLQSFDVDRARELADAAATLASELGEREQAVAALAVGWSLAYQGHGDRAVAALLRALAFYGPDEHPWERATVLQGLALATGALDAALDHAQQAAALFARVGDHSRYANTLYTMATRALNAGQRLGEAQGWLEESLRVSQGGGSEHDRVHAVLGLARLASERGRAAQAQPLLEECLPTLRRLGDRRCTGRALHLLGELARGRGETTRAAEFLRDSIAAAGPAADYATLKRARRALSDLGAAGG